MIDDVMDETVESLSDLGIDAEDIGLDQDDLGQIFDPELGAHTVLSEDEFENVVRAIARSRSDLDGLSSSVAEIDDYVDGFENAPERLSGLLSNIKGIYGDEIGEDARAAIEILSTQEPEFDNLPTSVPFAEYIRAKGIAFM